MAVTSIWPIKGRVDKVINYARNPEKTHDKERLSGLHEIEGVVEYAADEMKTEKRAYVTCLNLHSEETAAQEFMETKRLMHNEGGRSCYHGYQSFKADEVDADTAHSIGVALARELWGDRFQVVPVDDVERRDVRHGVLAGTGPREERPQVGPVGVPLGERVSV